MANRTHQFKHRDVVRAVRAAAAAGISNPRTVEVRLPNGTTIAVSGTDGRPAAAVVRPAVKPRPAAPSRRPMR
jgi:hypothetical protein